MILITMEGELAHWYIYQAWTQQDMKRLSQMQVAFNKTAPFTQGQPNKARAKETEMGQTDGLENPFAHLEINVWDRACWKQTVPETQAARWTVDPGLGRKCGPDI